MVADHRVSVLEPTPDDVSALAELIGLFNGPGVRVDRTAARVAQCADVERALLAHADGHVVGFACLQIVPALADDHPHATLTELFVRPSWRRRGIGRLLVQHAEARARAAGAEHLVLLTGFENHDAQAFYRALGFRDWSLAMHKPVTVSTA